MLYGSEMFQKEFLNDVFEYSQKKNWEVIFISVVGSCGKGFPSADSDYDTRVLYLDKKYPEKIFIPWKEKENKLKHRYYFNKEELASGKVWEWIPFWEVTSFFQFLKRPAFDNVDSLGLYNVIAWTMNSPFCWDPYGLQVKLKPFLDQAFRAGQQVSYIKEEMTDYLVPFDKQIELHNYIRLVYCALSIKWILKYNTFNPVYLPTLACALESKSIQEKVIKMINDELILTKKYVTGKASVHFGSAEHHIFVDHDLELDSLIEEMFEINIEKIEKGPTDDKVEEILEDLYRVLFLSINDDGKTLYVDPYRK